MDSWMQGCMDVTYVYGSADMWICGCLDVGFVCYHGFAIACGFVQAGFGTGRIWYRFAQAGWSLGTLGWVCAGWVCADWVCTGMTHEVKLVTLA